MDKIISWSGISQIVVGIAMGLVFLLFQFLNPTYVHFSIILFVLLFLYTLLGILYIFIPRGKTPKRLRLIFYTKILTDLVFITMSIHYAGEYHGLFIFLYTLPIITASLVSPKYAVWTFILALVSYSALELNGLLAIIGSGWKPVAGSIPEELQHFVILTFFGFLVAFQSGYYSSHTKSMYEELAKLKEEFLFRTVHDLRSPLASVGWMLEKYQKPDLIKKYPDIEKDITTMQDLTDRMKNLVRELTAVINGEQKDIVLKKDKVDAETILQSAMAEVEPSLADHSIKINFEPNNRSSFIIADEQALKEVLSNIIGNAIKYNVPGGSVNISNRKEDKYLRIDISDTGKGISAENIKKLFVPYFRADADKNIPGTGLGLYISKKLVEKMSGKINVAPTLGKGTTFSIYLPLDDKR